MVVPGRDRGCAPPPPRAPGLGPTSGTRGSAVRAGDTGPTLVPGRGLPRGRAEGSLPTPPPPPPPLVLCPPIRATVCFVTYSISSVSFSRTESRSSGGNFVPYLAENASGPHLARTFFGSLVASSARKVSPVGTGTSAAQRDACAAAAATNTSHADSCASTTFCRCCRITFSFSMSRTASCASGIPFLAASRNHLALSSRSTLMGPTPAPYADPSAAADSGLPSSADFRYHITAASRSPSTPRPVTYSCASSFMAVGCPARDAAISHFAPALSWRRTPKPATYAIPR
mmetsp:Transcript_2948/g.7132  ORF Transcript_2948/g.7132 Transcript_2948/m.7132 type:complete len:287 (+) Transcript_2948:83-943(+)